MKTMFERLDSRQPSEMLSMKRCELPQPPPGFCGQVVLIVQRDVTIGRSFSVLIVLF